MNTKPRVGIIVGSQLPPNEENILLSWGKMLADKFDLDLIVSRLSVEVPAHISVYYSIRDYSHSTVLVKRSPLLKEFLISHRILSEYVRALKPDVLLHITKPHTYGFAVALVGRRSRTPFVVRLGGNIFSGHRLMRMPLSCYLFLRVTCLAYLAFRLAPTIITIGENLTQQLIRLGINEEKIWTIPQPVDRERFSPPLDSGEKRECRKTWNLPPDHDIVLFVGRMTKLESTGLMTSIIEQVVARDNRVTFLFVGKVAPYAERLKEAGGDSVTITGEVPHQDMPDLYKAADLLIHISGGEGSIPNSVLEALASDLPICANRVGAVDSVTIHIFDTAEQFAGFILKRDWKRDPLPARFTWDSLRQQYIECLENLSSS
jgi:glycosyltransferase involved in cell wall biosynthesis